MTRQYTPIKYHFDELTAQWFRSRGYVVTMLGSPCFADVVALHPHTKKFAIIEVKSPREKDAVADWVTDYNIEDMSRRQVLEQIKMTPGYAEAQGLWRLYSFTLSSQLYTYYKTAREHFEMANKQNQGMRKIGFNVVKVQAYLVVPSQREGIARQVVQLFKTKGWLSNHRFYRTKDLVIISIQY